jgi:hypothetical protein
LYQPQVIGDGVCGKTGGMKIGRGNRSTRRKPAPAFTTNPTSLDPGLNPGRRGGKPISKFIFTNIKIIIKKQIFIQV